MEKVWKRLFVYTARMVSQKLHWTQQRCSEGERWSGEKTAEEGEEIEDIDIFLGAQKLEADLLFLGVFGGFDLIDGYLTDQRILDKEKIKNPTMI